jgi:NAD(P)-dependent dehydrogenase (short-subunit alcohol dehydrogenase family)
MGNVLVTGGGKRIGRAIAETLAGKGWAVAVHYKGAAEDAAEVVAGIEADGGRALCVKADLENEDEVRAMFAAAATGLGGLCAVVNNASVFNGDDVLSEGRTVWDQHMAVHVRAPFVLSQELLKHLSDKGAPDKTGAVINIVDQRVLNPSKHFYSYTLSKMSLWDQTQVLARAMAPHVRVNAVGPGPVLPSTRQSDEDFERQALQTPLQRAVDPREIADAVAFLLDASSVTGQIIAVDSGQHLNWAHETEETSPRE